MVYLITCTCNKALSMATAGASQGWRYFFLRGVALSYFSRKVWLRERIYIWDVARVRAGRGFLHKRTEQPSP